MLDKIHEFQMPKKTYIVIFIRMLNFIDLVEAPVVLDAEVKVG